MAIDQPELKTVTVKKYGSGKTRAWLTADARHADALAEALFRSLRVSVQVDYEFFGRVAREAGVPDEVIRQSISTIDFDDEVCLRKEWAS